MGDIESMIFLEALRQFQFLVGRENIVFVHVSLVPVLGSVGEQKTKPTQHSVKVRSPNLNLFLIVYLLFVYIYFCNYYQIKKKIIFEKYLKKNSKKIVCLVLYGTGIESAGFICGHHCVSLV